ncbi:uncharacterized protein [Triticum aestivum]|uniref:uncharacterized protein n=1 Tax=Triticum aestivum TaxID=4565 RepID=UPI001D033BEC|nr:uncharacterized protein LOC123101789 [Triticum aestivum]XP_044379023.1 uncharacterized protein LOC123101789 [Triticum aestivum]
MYTTVPTLYEAFEKWSEDVKDAALQKAVEMNLFGMGDHFIRPQAVRPAAEAILKNSKQLRAELAKYMKTLSKIEVNTPEGQSVLKEVKDVVSKMESDLASYLKSAEKASPESPPPVSFLAEFTEKVKKLNNSELSKALKEIEELAKTANIPFKVYGQYKEMEEVVGSLSATVAAYLASVMGNTPAPEQETKVPTPAEELAAPNPTELPEQCQVKPALKVPSFEKLGKTAIDVLYGGYNELPWAADATFCLKSSERLFPVMRTTISSSQAVTTSIKAVDFLGNGVQGSLLFIYPFSDTSMAKLRYAYEKALLGVRVGLHASPEVYLSAMVGTGFGVDGGFEMSFSTKTGLVKGFDLGVNCLRSEWGNASVSGSFVLDLEGEKKKKLRKIRALYSKEVDPRFSFAADVAFDAEKGKVLATGGVALRVDEKVLVKGRVSSNGAVAAVVEVAGEGRAKLKASAHADLYEVSKGPKVGFSVSFK